MAETEGGQPAYRSLQNLSLGGVAATYQEVVLPKKYRACKPGEVSTYQGAGIVPVCRQNGQTKILLHQPQKGKRAGVRWYDFGGKKTDKAEFTSHCACRKFAKQTYGLFGVDAEFSDTDVVNQLPELYHDLNNMPLMLKASEDWAQAQLMGDNVKIYYNDQHEYHIYLINVPYIPDEILTEVSAMVDGGKRMFMWLSPEDFASEALAPRLHTDGLMKQIAALDEEEWVKEGAEYSDGTLCAATSSFAATVVASS